MRASRWYCQAVCKCLASRDLWSPPAVRSAEHAGQETVKAGRHRAGIACGSRRQHRRLCLGLGRVLRTAGGQGDIDVDIVGALRGNRDDVAAGCAFRGRMPQLVSARMPERASQGETNKQLLHRGDAHEGYPAKMGDAKRMPRMGI